MDEITKGRWYKEVNRFALEQRNFRGEISTSFKDSALKRIH